MSSGQIIWDERIWRKTQITTLRMRVRQSLTTHDADLARRLKEVEKDFNKSQEEQLAKLEEILQELERRNRLRAQRRQELENLARHLQHQWERLKSRFRHYQEQGEAVWQQARSLMETLSRHDLAQDSIYRELKTRLETLPREWDRWLVQEARETLKEEIGHVDLDAPAWDEAADDLMPDLELPVPTATPSTSQHHLRRRLAALRPFLTHDEMQELESLPPEALEEALLEHEIRLQTLQAEAQALLSTYRDSLLLEPYLRRLAEALEQQDWSQVRMLVPQIQNLVQDPSWVQAMTLETFFRKYLPHYRIQWEVPGTVMMLEGDGTRARVQVDARSRTAHVEPERETPQFCRSMEEMARRAGLIWQPYNRRSRDRARTLPPRR